MQQPADAEQHAERKPSTAVNVRVIGVTAVAAAIVAFGAGAVAIDWFLRPNGDLRLSDAVTLIEAIAIIAAGVTLWYAAVAAIRVVVRAITAAATAAMSATVPAITAAARSAVRWTYPELLVGVLLGAGTLLAYQHLTATPPEDPGTALRRRCESLVAAMPQSQGRVSTFDVERCMRANTFR